jgi:(2Fe-2S) ferredoxin
VNKAGCLDRCAAGPVAVVYPEGTWYTFVDTSDIDEIVESHLKNGQVVDRLVTPENWGAERCSVCFDVFGLWRLCDKR